MKTLRGSGWCLPPGTTHLIFWQTVRVSADYLHLGDLRLCFRHWKVWTLSSRVSNKLLSQQSFLANNLDSFTKASPFGIFLTLIFVSPTKAVDCWNLCLIFTFCLASCLLAHVTYTPVSAWRGNGPLLFYHFQNTSLYLIYLQNLAPLASGCPPRSILLFWVLNPKRPMKVLLVLLPLSICPQVLILPRSKLGTCPQSITVCRQMVDSRQWAFHLWRSRAESWLLSCSITPSDRCLWVCGCAWYRISGPFQKSFLLL